MSVCVCVALCGGGGCGGGGEWYILLMKLHIAYLSGNI